MKYQEIQPLNDVQRKNCLTNLGISITLDELYAALDAIDKLAVKGKEKEVRSVTNAIRRIKFTVDAEDGWYFVKDGVVYKTDISLKMPEETKISYTQVMENEDE